MPEDRDEFADDSLSVVVKRRAAISVFRNIRGKIAVAQEDDAGGQNSIIEIEPRDVAAVIRAIRRAVSS